MAYLLSLRLQAHNREATTMVAHSSLLVTLVQLVDHIPLPPQPAQPGRGRPRVYHDRLFLKALIIMLIRHYVDTTLEHRL
jgi:hypothetical protein